MVRIKDQAGLSLIELMIASVLGLLLILGVAQLFVGSSGNFRLAESIGRMQESGRMAHEILGRAVRNADYWGCIPHGDVGSLIPSASRSEFHDFAETDGGAIQISVADGSANTVSGSHILRFKTAEALGFSMAPTAAMGNPNSDVVVVSDVDLDSWPLTPLLLADCTDGVVFVPSQINSTSFTPASGPPRFNVTLQHTAAAYASFPKAFTAGDLMRPTITEYRLENNGGQFSLRRETETGTVELISDVVGMELQVGTGPSPGAVVTAWSQNFNSANLDNAKALRVSLLVRSPRDGIADSAQTACFPAWVDCTSGDNWDAATVFGASDRHFYRVYTSTYSIRNRLLDRS